MFATYHGKFIKDLIKLLGLPPRVRSFEIRCAVNEVMTVKCECLPDIVTVDSETIFKKYIIMLKELPDIYDLWAPIRHRHRKNRG